MISSAPAGAVCILLSLLSGSDGNQLNWERFGAADAVDLMPAKAQIHSDGSVDALAAEVIQLRQQIEAYQRHTYQEDMQIAIAAEQQENFCMDGKLVPEFFLIGSLKTSSTLLADNFNLSPGVVESKCRPGEDYGGAGACPPGGQFRKEPQFFNNPETVDRGYSYWLEHWPHCSQQSRMVAADMSVGYLMEHQHVLPVLSEFYGHKLRRVTFVVTMREPMATLQSYFYYMGIGNGGSSFKDWVQGVMDDPSQRLQVAWRNSMYHNNLATWFESINRSQFMIVPMKYNTEYNKGTPPFHEYLWNHFGLQHAPARDDVKETSNVNPHPALEDDLGTDLYARLSSVMNNLTGPDRLARLFVDNNQNDDPPYLYGLKDASGLKGWKHNETAIADWIQDGW